jgi:hypothetical protein
MSFGVSPGNVGAAPERWAACAEVVACICRKRGAHLAVFGGKLPQTTSKSQ